MTTQSINGWIDKPLEGFYAHIYSNGHSVKNLFETEEDRIFGMNASPHSSPCLRCKFTDDTGHGNTLSRDCPWPAGRLRENETLHKAPA